MERHHDLVAEAAASEGRRLPPPRPHARRAADRLPRDGRRRHAGLALRPPASRREHGRMVDGGRARRADRSRRPGRARAAGKVPLPRRPQLQPRRQPPRPPAHQCGGRQPQPRMARAERGEVARSARDPQCDGRDRGRFRDGRPRRRGDRRGVPRRVRGHPVVDRRAGRGILPLSSASSRAAPPTSRPPRAIPSRGRARPT